MTNPLKPSWRLVAIGLVLAAVAVLLWLLPPTGPVEAAATYQGHDRLLAYRLLAVAGYRFIAVLLALAGLVVLVLGTPHPARPSPRARAAGLGVLAVGLVLYGTFAVSRRAAPGANIEERIPLTGNTGDSWAALRRDLACAVPDTEMIHPASGALIVAPRGVGHGRLQVRNDRSLDAAVLLVDASTGDVGPAVFVRAGERVTVSAVPSGTFRVRFQRGRHWSRPGRAFCAERSNFEFDNLFYFSEPHDTNGVRWSRWSITLNANSTDGRRFHAVADSETDIPKP